MNNDPDKLSENPICYGCVGEDFLSDEIKRTGLLNTCFYCESEDTATLLQADIAERVQKVFEHSYVLTNTEPSGIEYMMMNDSESSYDWEREGEDAANIVEQITKVRFHIAEDIVAVLNQQSNIDYRRDPGAEEPFAEEARYEETGIDAYSLQSTWEEMKYELHHNARFFNQRLGSFLGDLFSDIYSKRGRKKQAIRTIKPDTKDGTSIYRARVATTSDSLKEILEGAPVTLAAPTRRKVRAGRMNAAGISVFYGAFDRDTCLAEVRPPVGSKVVMGRFELLRPVRLLDLAALERVYVKRSLFHPQYLNDNQKCVFLRTLSRRFSKPVMPGEEDFDYLLTQAVCEYLAGSVEPPLDGIIFRSSQRGTRGSNVTFFNHASHVEDLRYPKGTVVDSSLPSREDFDDDDSYCVWVQLPEKLDTPQTLADPILSFDFSTFSALGSISDTALPIKPTLRLRLSEVEVMEIKGVTYSKYVSPVKRHEHTRHKTPS